jgi:hypothetical protein
MFPEPDFPAHLNHPISFLLECTAIFLPKEYIDRCFVKGIYPSLHLVRAETFRFTEGNSHVGRASQLASSQRYLNKDFQWTITE